MVDLDDESRLVGQRPVKSIFFGGGTPSLFSPESIHKIKLGVGERLNLDNNIEITMEANPGTFEQNNFSEFKSAGINRLSIGIQSFDDQLLKNIGRIHDGQQARSAISTAIDSGFENINLDLMFGLPEQTAKQATNDINIACEHDVQHISHYQLTIEPNTYFHKHTPVLPDSELLWAMQDNCHGVLYDNNFYQYEVSAFSKKDRQCKHNLNYWTFGDYIGIGAGAHGKLTESIDNNNTYRITRRWKKRQPNEYMTSSTVHDSAVIKTDKIIFEFLLNALRLKQGITCELFEKNTNLNKNTLIDACKSIDSDLIIIDKARVKTTDKGYRFLNDVLEKLL
jgi:oxygen-independent coproporphyrinogen-3 oxidase